jgi:SP family myo-inositol transporter-like MFS transporter 13
MTDDLKKSAVTGQAALPKGSAGYNRFLLLVAGLGGLLYGVDVGINARQLSFIVAGCTAVYFFTAMFFLPETKGKTLEEIEEYFEGAK